MDPVDHKSLKGKFKDRKDKDIDNDGDTDASDKYLHKRRKAISKAIGEAKKLSAKDVKNALASDEAKAKPKNKVSLQKAPWDMKKEEVDLGEMFDKVHPTLKKELGSHGDHAIGMAGSDKGVAVSFDRPKDINALSKQMAQHGYKNVTKTNDASGKHKHTYHFSEEVKEATWKSTGHYTEDGEEWDGDQHYDEKSGMVMTGKTHDADSQNLYHYKDLSPEARTKVKIKEEVEQLEELTAVEKKLIDQMYDKKGNLTPLGKKVMDHGKAANKLTPKDKDADNARRKEYNAYQKSNRNEEVDLDEAAPKIKPDFLKTQRAKDAEHNAAMNRTKTGRKKPVRAMSSTQRSLASMRKEEVNIDEALKVDTKIRMAAAKMKREMEKEGKTPAQIDKAIKVNFPSLSESVKLDGVVSRILNRMTEAKDAYTISHKTFSSAVQHAEDVVKKRGFEIDPDMWDRKVAMGPKKPGSGKTNSYTIELMKDGKETKKKLQMQVYYDEGRYELNMYIS